MIPGSPWSRDTDTAHLAREETRLWLGPTFPASPRSRLLPPPLAVKHRPPVSWNNTIISNQDILHYKTRLDDWDMLNILNGWSNPILDLNFSFILSTLEWEMHHSNTCHDKIYFSLYREESRLHLQFWLWHGVTKKFANADSRLVEVGILPHFKWHKLTNHSIRLLNFEKSSR